MAEGFKTAIWVFVIILGVILIVGTVTQYWNSATMPLKQYVFFGTESLDFNTTTAGGEIGGLITALMIWLIIFAGFGDILENFSAFSRGIAWVMAFALAVVGANVGLIQYVTVWLVGAFVWAGSFAMFAALLAAFFAFFVVNWGISGLTTWVSNRQKMMKAATGRTYASEGLRTMKKVGQVATEDIQ